jgi:two-component system cell cycle response regulator DivK
MPAPRKILVVEDNEIHMKIMRELLRDHGYLVLEAHEGEQALALARQHQPDLVLMDINLPEVSGLEVAQWIWAEAEPEDRANSRCFAPKPA